MLANISFTTGLGTDVATGAVGIRSVVAPFATPLVVVAVVAVAFTGT